MANSSLDNQPNSQVQPIAEEPAGVTIEPYRGTLNMLPPDTMARRVVATHETERGSSYAGKRLTSIWDDPEPRWRVAVRRAWRWLYHSDDRLIDAAKRGLGWFIISAALMGVLWLTLLIGIAHYRFSWIAQVFFILNLVADGVLIIAGLASMAPILPQLYQTRRIIPAICLATIAVAMLVGLWLLISQDFYLMGVLMD